MGNASWLTAVRGRAAKSLPHVTRWIWVVALITVATGVVKEFEPGSFWSAGMWVTSRSFAVWAECTFCFSLLFLFADRQRWRSRTWFSLLTWASATGAVYEWLATCEWVPSFVNYFDANSVSESIRYAFYFDRRLPLNILDAGLWVSIALFLFVLSLHPQSERGIAFGGRWRPVWALALGIAVAVLVARFNPIYLYRLLTVGEVADAAFDLAQGWGTMDFLVDWLAILLPLGSAIAVMAWKTRANLTVTDNNMAVDLGRGLGIFSVRWNRVLSVTEVVENGERRSIIVEHGVLPWYRLRFGLHLRRDGPEAIDQVWRHAPNKSRTDLRRGTRLAGYILLAATAVCVVVVQQTMYASTVLMSSSVDESVQNFVGLDHFLLFGWLMIGAGLFLGTGCGLLFASNYAAVRALPLLGVALCASFLPNPVMYWLVYIAIHAILLARLGPIETHPYIPFPDHRVSEFALWANDGKALFAVIGYVVGTMIVLKPCTRFLPGWPYRLPGSSMQSGDTSDPEQATVESA